MVLVTKPERRKGHGTRLLLRCIAEIEASGAAMGLDATEFGRPIYLPLGFRDVYPLSRWSAGQHTRRLSIRPPASPSGQPARPIWRASPATTASAAASSARAVLGNLLARAPHVAHVAERGDGSLAGYGLGRDGHRATHVGPVVAEDQAIGLALAEPRACRRPRPRDPGRAGPAWHASGSGLHRTGARRRGASCVCSAALPRRSRTAAASSLSPGPSWHDAVEEDLTDAGRALERAAGRRAGHPAPRGGDSRASAGARRASASSIASRSAPCRATTSMPARAGWQSACTRRNSRSAMSDSIGRCWSWQPRRRRAGPGGRS